MKKIAGKIAMILVIVMLVNCLTGCAVMAFVIGSAVVLGGTVIWGIISIFVSIAKEAAAEEKAAAAIMERGPRRTNPYLFENSTLNRTIRSLPKEEHDSLLNTYYSLPESEVNLFVGRLNSLSETESNFLLESLNSFSEEECAVLAKEFNSMRETDIVYSLEHVNSLPETVPLTHFIQNIEVDVSAERVYEKLSFRY